MTEEEYKTKVKQVFKLLKECESAEIDFDEETVVFEVVLGLFPKSEINQDVFAHGVLTLMDGLKHV